MTDRRMSAFTLRLLGRSMRWVAPAILYLVAGALVLANPGPVLANAVVMFPVQGIVLCWLSVVIGNIDDDGHRELCTAIAGSPGRLLIDRSVAAFMLATAAAGVTTVALMMFSAPRLGPVPDLAAVALVELAGGMIGVGIGALLHRPILRHIGATVVAAIAALMLCMATPPTTHLLREINAGHDLAAVALCGAAGLTALVLTGVASRIARPLAR